MLTISGLNQYYGGSHILRDVSMDVPMGACTTVLGRNGVGKTTTIGKVAFSQKANGRNVMLAAGDTFRAAAREQLATWAERNQITVIAQQGRDAASVIFDAVQSARAKNIDVLLADTAGRLHTQLPLMEELRNAR